MKRLAAHMVFGSITAILTLGAILFKPFATTVEWLLEWAEQYVEKDIDGH